MAEYFNDSSDHDVDIIDEELISKFNAAAKFLPQIVSTLESSVLLQLYALYKQANVGSCNIPKPSWFRTQEKMKWEAWSSLKDMPKDIAMEKYISVISEIDSSWMSREIGEKNQGWIAVSTLSSTDAIKDDSEKTIIDYCKDGNKDKVSTLLNDTEKNLLDSDGLGLLHWAADRGHLQIIELLIQHGFDINLTDNEGQTALHYAVSCGHKDCIEYLLDYGIDSKIQDHDGTLAIELTDDAEIKSCFKSSYL